MTIAANYLIGLPVAVVGLLLILAFKPVGDLFAATWRAQAKWLAGGRKNSVLYLWLSFGTTDSLPSRLYRYGIVVTVGVSFLVAGVLAVLGVWNPYE